MENKLQHLKEIAEYAGRKDIAAQLATMQHAQENGNFLLTLMGQYSAGKSSLINRLVGKTVLPTETTETTALITYLQYDEKQDMTQAIGRLRQEQERQAKQMEKFQQETQAENTRVLMELKQVIMQLGTRMGNMAAPPVPTPSDIPPVSDSNLVRLMTTVNNALGDAANQLTEYHTAATKQQAEDMNQYVDMLTKKFDGILERCVEQLAERMEQQLVTLTKSLQEHEAKQTCALEKELQDYAEQLVEKSAQAVARVQKDNNEKLQTLSESLTKLSEENRTFREIVQISNQQMHKDVQQLVQQYTTFAEDLRQQDSRLKERMEELTRNLQEHEAKQTDALAKKLHDYAEELVDKSAQAVARVQKDNNEKLQTLADSLTKLSEENSTFLENAQKLNQQLHKDVQQLIQQHTTFVDTLYQQAEKSIRSTEIMLQSHSKKTADKLAELGTKNAEQFHTAMDEYRERFVKANAEALAAVQGDLQADLKATYEQLAKLEGMMQTSLSLLEGYRSAVTESQKQMQQTLQSYTNESKDIEKKMERHYSNFGKDIDRQLGKYNKKFEELAGKIVEIMASLTTTTNLVRENTKAYNDALQQIQKHQNDVFALSKKDVELLERMMKKT